VWCGIVQATRLEIPSLARSWDVHQAHGSPEGERPVVESRSAVLPQTILKRGSCTSAGVMSTRLSRKQIKCRRQCIGEWNCFWAVRVPGHNAPVDAQNMHPDVGCSERPFRPRRHCDRLGARRRPCAAVRPFERINDDGATEALGGPKRPRQRGVAPPGGRTARAGCLFLTRVC
jgi:hypothetical protein